MAELGRLQHSCGAQADTVEQIRTREVHPNSMCVVTVGPPELPPAHGLVICWNIVGFKSPATNVTAGLHLDGTGYVRDIRVRG
jgi:hypothetical protein